MAQQELADKLKIGKTTVSNYETGYSKPDTDTLIQMSKIFNVSLNYLTGINLSIVEWVAHTLPT